ncbi:MAG: hypothetical protein J6O56_03880 [Bacilli bacterium]|nr:hypothetical protein [Bacilli bacterium]
MAINEEINQIIDQLIEKMNIKDEEKKKKLLERDNDTIRELGMYGDRGFSSEEILDIDFSSLKKIKEAYEQNDSKKVMRLLENFDFDTLEYLHKVALKKKISDIVYRLCINNLGSDEKEVKEELSIADLGVKRLKRPKLLRLVDIKKNEK